MAEVERGLLVDAHDAGVTVISNFNRARITGFPIARVQLRVRLRDDVGDSFADLHVNVGDSRVQKHYSTVRYSTRYSILY